MNSWTLLKAIGELDDGYILSAQERMTLTPAGTPAGRRRRLSKLLTALIAAVLMLLSTVGTAMAVNEEFREAVFTFLGIHQTVVIPEYSSGPADGAEPIWAEQQTFGYEDLIGGTCIHAPEGSYGRNGMFYLCTDPVMMKSGSHFEAYGEQNGQLIPLEPHRFSQDYSVLGNAIHVEFDWVENCGIGAVLNSPAGETSWLCSNLAGSPESVLMLFRCTIPESGEYTNYPVLVNWKTGELTDILAGTGAERLPHIQTAAFSDDRSKLLLLTGEGDFHCADLKTGTLRSITLLSGERPDKCAFAGETLACWVLEGETVRREKQATFPETRSFGTYRIWSIDLNTWQRTELFESLPAAPATSHDVWAEFYSPIMCCEPNGEYAERYPDGEGNYILEDPEPEPAGLYFLEGFDGASHYGNSYAGTCFALEVNQERKVYVIDLEDGRRSPVEGFVWPDLPYPLLECQPSPDGRKLLIYGQKADSASYLGVLDFDRKSYLDVTYEDQNQVSLCDITWFDHDRIIAATDAVQGARSYYIVQLWNE